MRFFRAPTEICNAIRRMVMDALGQPNGRADEPWPMGGDFAVEAISYVSLAPHHTDGEPWETLLTQAAAISGVEEIHAEIYKNARPNEGHETQSEISP